MAKGTGDEAMVPAAADFGEVGNGKEVGFEEAIFGAWGSEGGAEGESGAEGDGAGIPAIGEGMEDGGVVETAVGFFGIGEEIRDEEEPHYLGEWRRRETIAMISVEVGVIGVALFGGVEDIDHFASGEVMEVDMGVGIGELTEGLVEMAHGLAEEHGGVFGVRAVGMEFDESPVGATLYGDAGFLPNAEAVDRGGVSAGEVAIFDAREDPVFAALPIEGEGALDDEEFVWAGGLVMGERADGAAVVVGFWGRGGLGVVEGIDGLGLGGMGCGRHGEIGVAAGVDEDLEFVGDAAVLACGVGVIEGPVSVNEPVANSAGGVAGEEAVFGEVFHALVEGEAEMIGVIAIVMEVDFGFAFGGGAEFGESLKDLGVILFDGIEESVFGGLAVGVMEFGSDGGKIAMPLLDSG